jgi:hypothetical protein
MRTEVNNAVLIIDSDLGFAFWLGQALDRAGYEAFPARNVADSVALLSEIPMVPRLVIFGGNPAGADALIDKCRTRHKDLRVLRLRDDSQPISVPAFPFDAEIGKPASRTEEDRAELLRAIDRVTPSEASQSPAVSLPLAR